MSLVVSDFEGLAQAITQAHEHLLTQAARAINVNLTLRNWLIGCYIYEYEQGGTDRATYGERLLDRLAERLTVNGLRNCSGRELRRYRQFYLTYPQIRESLPHESIQLLPGQLRDASIRGTLSPELTQSGVTLTANLSFSHLAELMQIDDPLKRAFYEIESLRGRWSVRELKRQIASTLVEYALAGMDNRLFVSKYQLALPGKEEMRRFIEAQMAAELGGAAGPQRKGDA